MLDFYAWPKNYLRNRTGPPARSPTVLLTTVRVLVEQLESFSSEGETIGVSSFINAPNGSFSVTGVRTGLLSGDSAWLGNLRDTNFNYECARSRNSHHISFTGTESFYA